MNTTALQIRSVIGTSRPGAFERVVSSIAIGMLRWCELRSKRRMIALERSVSCEQVGHDRSDAADYARTVRHLRLG